MIILFQIPRTFVLNIQGRRISWPMEGMIECLTTGSSVSFYGKVLI